MSEKFEKGFDFEKLVIMSFDGSITADDFRRLDDMLGRESDSRKKYFDLLKLNQSLRSYENILCFVPDSIRGKYNGQQEFDGTGLDVVDYQDIGRNGNFEGPGRMETDQIIPGLGF
ncbi:MAG: hypothetical protein DRP65_03340 [Planctomycetota bacterium]|nr:MAG: hypothetical protein DRP65_03340 [Planctomycetota bacterium]